MYAPVKPVQGSWDTRRTEVGETLIDYVTEFIPNFRRDCANGSCSPPKTSKTASASPTERSATSHDPQPDARRPAAARGGLGDPIEGLYLCGAGTHPGGEVTGAPGHNAAHALLARRSARVVAL